MHPDAFSALIRDCSPYLTRLAERHADLLAKMQEKGADALCRELMETLAREAALITDQPALMRCLRLAKAKLALLVAAADIAGEWPLERVTLALAEFADAALSQAVNFLLRNAARRGDVLPPHADSPSRESGLIVLGMGKLGAFELNYSSDIDLIIFYERDRLAFPGKIAEPKFFNRLAQDIVQIMQERTGDGYVFRTDLRLRPDPASTPPAVTTDAAYYYYESVGQNWERAAMIKARPVAGDIAAGERFLKAITPFLWRRNLDFASIQDIHSIKRQMDARLRPEIRVPGHNIKLGLGGIREIEFFTQIHQLIWGGREPQLRTRGTCETLGTLTRIGLVEPSVHDTLVEAYAFLRRVEHRLQMVADQQTHELPSDAAALSAIARFCGFGQDASFEQALLERLTKVHDIFAHAFESAERLDTAGGNLVFTGVTHDPATLQTLSGMGYLNPASISERVMSWHHGAHRATRTQRARELLTELMPALLKSFSATADPDAAFLHFDEFLNRMPAGVQLFSLFNAHPQLLSLIADIMGSAPVLAETLSRHPDLLDGVLFSDFYQSLPDKSQLNNQLQELLRDLPDFGERMEAVRRFKNERQFQAGVQLLRGMIDARVSGAFLSDLADSCLEAVLQSTEEEFAATHGRIPGSRFCVLALGKLGSRELTFNSDIDLVFVYDVPDFNLYSDGAKSFTAGVYYNRLVPRLLNAVTSLGREGRLYEADTRLRPSGNQGLKAVSLKAFVHYFDELAWTFEFMALTRGRAVAGDASLCAETERLARYYVALPRDGDKLRADIGEMRERVARELPALDEWNVKYARGGLMDIDFLCQYFLLAHASKHPSLTGRSSPEILSQLKELAILDQAIAEELAEAYRFISQLSNIMRLCINGKPNEAQATHGLKTLLARSFSLPDFARLKETLCLTETKAYKRYRQFLSNPPEQDS